MSVKRGGLGRNLSALLGSAPTSVVSQQPAVVDGSHVLAINLLEPGQYQPRTVMDEENLAELSSSIKQQGLLQPIVVRPIAEERYEIIAGERRWRACLLAELTEIPVIIRKVDDETAMAMALVENLQREDLNPIDQARAMQRLHDEFGLTHQQIADILAKSRTAVSNYLRLMALAKDVVAMVENGDLDMGHARALLALETEQQRQAAALIVAKNLSVRETERLVNRIKEGKAPQEASNPREVPLQTQEQLHSLAAHLQAKVRLKPGKNGKGTIIIHYDNLHNLENVINQIINK